LHSRPEKVIAVVSHSAFLRTAVTHRRFANADFRIFDFENVIIEKGKERVELREWEKTSENGGGMGWSMKGVHGVLDGDFDDEEEDGVDGEADGEIPN
jgi:hypothetical protein